ncbi:MULTISPECIES: hypothetical protein [Streptomyces]|uniref:hypothetical protein n=1 Tax=Streptomyces TaxID=1883 RepID=UPI00148781D6|nr:MULTISPECIES: hypothetical protein [Streptomyces]
MNIGRDTSGRGPQAGAAPVRCHVDAFEDMAAAVRSDAASAVDWLEVSRHMRREGCCDPESGG